MGSMSWYGTAYFGAVASAVALTPLAMRLARMWGIIDRPDARKVHSTPMPRAGGLAIAMAMMIVAVPVLLMAGHGLDRRAVVLFTCAAVAMLVGLVDDVFGVSAKLRLLVLLAAGAAFASWGGRIESLNLWGELSVQLGWMSAPVTVLWLVGLTVAVNFIDGLDGLAAGIAAIAAAVLAVSSGLCGNTLVAITALALLGSLSGFLFFNFNPARVFMGDCGSMFLGFMLAGCCVLAAPTAGTTRGLVLPAMALSVPILDTALTLLRRGLLQRRSIFSSDRGHLHHRLVDMGLSQRQAVAMLHGVTVATVAAGAAALAGTEWLLVSLTVLIPLWLGLMKKAGSIGGAGVLATLRRNRQLARERLRHRQVMEAMQLRFNRVQSFDQWWGEVCATAEALDFVDVHASVERRDGSVLTLHWSRPSPHPPTDPSMEVVVPVDQRRSGGTLRIRVRAAVRSRLESAGHRIAVFSRLMDEHSLARVRGCGGRVAASSGRNPDAARRPARSARSRALRHPVRLCRDAQTGGTVTPLPLEVDGPRIAIVHDFLYVYGGAERVLEQMVRLFPHADLFSLFDFLPPDQRHFILGKPVATSFIQRIPLARRKHRALLPLMPLAIEQLDVSPYDIVISSSYLAAKGVLTRPDQLHICYCHSPARFAWDMQHQYLAEAGLTRGVKSLLARIILHYLRNWDYRSAGGVDVFVTNSDFIGRRVAKVYRRPSTTIYPPVDIESFQPEAAKGDFYLTASRLVPYKRVDLIVDAFTRMGDRRLIVVGDGPDLEKVASRAGPNVMVAGYQPPEQLRRYMQYARAFVFAAEEDFGIVPVEAQACGTPVIAYARGGVTESVIDGETGLFFNEQTPQSLIAAVRRFEQLGPWDAQRIRQNVRRFSVDRFRQEFSALVQREWARFRSNRRLRGSLRPPAPSQAPSPLQEQPVAV